MKLYSYVGPKEIKNIVVDDFQGSLIKSYSDIEKFFLSNYIYKTNNLYVLTYIINKNGYLQIADRHVEHIRCSGGKPVLSAGEISFAHIDTKYEIIEITNQSTGFCPNIKSWTFVKNALELVPLNHPGKFTSEFIFRICNNCGQINIIKESIYICYVCDNEFR